MKYLLPLVFIVITIPGFSQLKIVKLNSAAIPKAIRYEGKIVNAVKWTDSLGQNLVITTQTEETQSKNAPDDGYRDKALYAYHYIIEADSIRQTWKLYDYIKECMVDIRADYIKNTFAVTDLNKNGKAEVWLMYKTVCHGDVSPSNMKIIMYENDKKFAVRGTNRVKFSEKEFMGGEYTFDDAFKTGPKAFRDYAKKLWDKNILETWE
jgi:hypothetical protein